MEKIVYKFDSFCWNNRLAGKKLGRRMIGRDRRAFTRLKLVAKMETKHTRFA